MRPLFFAFPKNHVLARSLAADCNAEMGELRWHRFPDGESLVTLDADCQQRDIVIVCTLRDPDGHALPLLFAARTARELGARSVGLVAPYLAYLRQDANFHPGEAISSVHFAAFISWTFDWLATVDPHLHRHSDLEALFDIPARRASAMSVVADWIGAHVQSPILVGPDSESAQWVQPVAAQLNAPLVVLAKERHGDRSVEVTLPDRDIIAGHTPVLVDDIISSGHTLLETLRVLREVRAQPAICIAVHGLFADGADQRLLAAGAQRLVTTNCVEHSSNEIDVTPILVPLLLDLLTIRPP
ncbi:ribose-phosphate diphosphokinase [Tahibacter amnicola]|uniref:Ribose-phosphate diphosphokinase n=1 Tax=Tahibacter amnicola TaxID=2976241 RepID=A0ABY6B7W4_9GAMM|nr:ribose-phosphate diphosphokinase [Tahibacter amnicola]UXI65984.1 ribose-phosphate diphosphokinase [Tahibacter amnicola]